MKKWTHSLYDFFLMILQWGLTSLYSTWSCHYTHFSFWDYNALLSHQVPLLSSLTFFWWRKQKANPIWLHEHLPTRYTLCAPRTNTGYVLSKNNMTCKGSSSCFSQTTAIPTLGFQPACSYPNFVSSLDTNKGTTQNWLMHQCYAITGPLHFTGC